MRLMTVLAFVLSLQPLSIRAQAQATAPTTGTEQADTTPRHVVIDKAPDKDSWDMLSVFMNVILVLVAIVTLAVVGRQTVETAKAAQATEVAAKAALLNAQAVIDSERARVVADLQPYASRGPRNIWFRYDGAALGEGDILAGLHVSYRLRIANMGRTPAEFHSYEIRWGSLTEGSKFAPERLDNRLFQNFNEFIGQGESRVLHQMNVRDMFQLDREVLDGKVKGAVCITIKYGIVFEEQRNEHSTFHLFYYSANASHPLERITVESKYT